MKGAMRPIVAVEAIEVPASLRALPLFALATPSDAKADHDHMTLDLDTLLAVLQHATPHSP